MVPSVGQPAMQMQEHELSFPSHRHNSRRGACSRGDGAATNRGGARNRRLLSAKEAAPTLTPLYKTRLCNFFKIGACHKGAGCCYAHGEEDLRASPNFERTSVCPIMLSQGSCAKPDCRYAHDASELRCDLGLLKTKMCSFYLSGLCVVGDACRFAHKAEELQESRAVQIDAAPTGTMASTRTNADLWEMRRSMFSLSKGPSVSVSAQPPPEPPVLSEPMVREAAPVMSEATKTEESVSPARAALSALRKRFARQAPEVQEKPCPVEPASLPFCPPPPLPYPAVPLVIEQAQSSPPTMLPKVDPERGAEVTSVKVRPAHVVKGRVIIQMDDDDDDINLPMVGGGAEPVLLANAGGSVAGPPAQPASSASSSRDWQASSSAAAPKSAMPQKTRAPSGRTAASGLAKEDRVILDIEDYGAIAGRSRPSSADPPLVEVRRRARTGASPSRCSISKGIGSHCQLAGRFSECAMCPRGRGRCGSSESVDHAAETCAACNIGVRIVARNTFLTIEGHEPDKDKERSKRRSRSS